MLTSIFVLFAEVGADKAATEASPTQMLYQFAPFIGILVLAYFFFWRPMRRQESERQAMLSKMKKNDEILTTGGIYATIVEVSEKEDKITVKIADNVRVKIVKAAIARNLTNEEEAAKAKSQTTTTTTKEGAA
jgi:preprotein translocase subunit YajC